VVHEVAPAGDRLQRDPELLEQLRLRSRRRRLEGPRLLLALVLVEHDPDPHPAVARRPDGARDVVAHGARKPHVVEREVERLAGRLQPGHQPRRDVLGTLSAILQRHHFDRIHGAAVWRVEPG
jgi:hypothetical protein